MDTLATIKNILKEIYDINPEMIKLETNLEELGFDEDNIFDLLDDIQAEYDLDDYLYDDVNLVTITDLIAYVESVIKNKC
ncbi:MAG: phosphopantetheine-binding protein [Erysipelotrichaceae bacterium]|nr:phosphopantetheine-binding protein [Erysipelotrichaceae bacterium]